MPSDEAPVRVEFTPEFKRNVRTLSRKYRHIRTDVEPVINQLQTGDFVGDQITGTRFVVFKIRVKNSDISKRKSAGYRLIYSISEPDLIILLTIYSKLDQADITADQIRRIIREFEEYPG